MTRTRRYDENQKAILAQLKLLHEDHMTARRELRLRIEEEYRDRMNDFEFRESRLMNKALRTVDKNGKGIAKTDIGRAVGTANWNLLAEKYALTADEFETETRIDPADLGPAGGEIKPYYSEAKHYVYARVTRWRRFALDFDIAYDGNCESVRGVAEIYNELDWPELENLLQNNAQILAEWMDFVNGTLKDAHRILHSY